MFIFFECFWIFQLECSVFDSVNPENVALTNLTVTVTRNDVRPRFGNNDQSTSILETTSVGSSVASVEASDDEGVGTRKWWRHVLEF